MVERRLPKPQAWVRFPSPAPCIILRTSAEVRESLPVIVRLRLFLFLTLCCGPLRSAYSRTFKSTDASIFAGAADSGLLMEGRGRRDQYLAPYSCSVAIAWHSQTWPFDRQQVKATGKATHSLTWMVSPWPSPLQGAGFGISANTGRVSRSGCRSTPTRGDASRGPHEEVDGRAALHGEDVVGEHVGGDGQQKANGVRVGLIHEVSGSVRCRHRAGSSSACCCRCEPGTAPAGHRHPRGWFREPM